MDISTLILIGLALVLVFLAYQRGDGTLPAGFAGTWGAAKDLIPLLVAILFVIGFSEVLLPKELISHWLGGQSGLKGIMIACGLGAITPGGPFVSYPLVATFYKAGAGIGPLVSFITAWSLWAFTRMPLEVSLVGIRLTLIRLVSTLLFPPLAGMIAGFFFD